GAYATKMLIHKRFGWPGLDSDVHWYVGTCHVGKDKFKWALKFAEEHKYSIKDFRSKPLDLVLVKNMITESSLSAKMLPQFHEPMVVLTRTQEGNYVVAEMDGTVWQERVAAFRVVPYHTGKPLSIPRGIEEWIDITPAKLKELKKEQQKPAKLEDQDITFDSVRLHESSNSELGLISEEESGQEESQLAKRIKKPSWKVRKMNKFGKETCKGLKNKKKLQVHEIWAKNIIMGVFYMEAVVLLETF
ncbi:hypothetical protein J132_00196, partial [Termitomyces sp. J132]